MTKKQPKGIPISDYLLTFAAKLKIIMKKIILIICFALLGIGAYAQQSLAGRVYQCANVLEKEIEETKKDVSKEAKTDEEKEEVKSIDALMDAIVSKITLTFIDSKTVELCTEIKFDEEKAKRKGVSWIMRKLVKMKIGKGRSEKGQVAYTVEGRRVTLKNKSNKKNSDQTCELSEDGKSLYLFLKSDKENRKVVLKRIK